MRKILFAAMLASTVSLGGCVATGSMNGFSKDPMVKVITWKNPDYGPMTDADYQAVTAQANFCQHEVVDKQVSGALESEVTLGAAYGVAGALGVGGGALAGGVGTLGAMTPYGAIAGATNGVVAGAQMHSMNQDYLVGYCASQNMSDAKSKRQGVHIAGSYQRTRNHSGRLPSWVVPASQAPQQASAYDSGSHDSDVPPPPPPR